MDMLQLDRLEGRILLDLEFLLEALAMLQVSLSIRQECRELSPARAIGDIVSPVTTDFK
jgi:hypothetical protein